MSTEEEDQTAMHLFTAAGRTFGARRADPAEIVDLRWRILRAGLPREEAIFPGDELPTSLHYAAVEPAPDEDGRQANDGGNGRRSDGGVPVVVSCATLHLEPWEGERAYRLRGMATADGRRGLGLGRVLLELAVADVRRETPVRLLWCNARTPALAFYRRQGWEARSDVFDIPTAGPHVRMTKRLG